MENTSRTDAPVTPMTPDTDPTNDDPGCRGVPSGRDNDDPSWDGWRMDW